MPLGDAIDEVSNCFPKSSKQARVHGCNALAKLLESSARAARHVRMVVLACASFKSNRSAEINLFFDVKKELCSHDFGPFFFPMPKLMVTFPFFNELPVRKFNGNFSSKKRGCK